MPAFAATFIQMDVLDYQRCLSDLLSKKNVSPVDLNEDDYLHPPHIHKFILISPSFSPQISQLIKQ